MVIFTCKECGESIEWDFEGSSLVCPKCGAVQPLPGSGDCISSPGVFAVPELQERPAEEGQQDHPKEEDSQKEDSRKPAHAKPEKPQEAQRLPRAKGKTAKLVAAACAVLAVVALVVALLVLVALPEADRQKQEAEQLAANEAAYAAAAQLEEDKSYLEAAEAFEALGSFEDAADRASKATQEAYSQAKSWAKKGKFKKAAAQFASLGDYKKSQELCATYTVALAKVGDTVTFGSYQGQDIAWRVLDKEKRRLLVISENVLDAVTFGKSLKATSWEKSYLRSWLNDTFLNDAFSKSQRKYIAQTSLTTGENAEYGTSGCGQTTDRLFCLSLEAVEMYFEDDAVRMATPTQYAEEQGATVYEDGCFWWLRSPGSSKEQAACVLPYGGIDPDGGDVDVKMGVRPAMWLEF